MLEVVIIAMLLSTVACGVVTLRLAYGWKKFGGACCLPTIATSLLLVGVLAFHTLSESRMSDGETKLVEARKLWKARQFVDAARVFDEAGAAGADRRVTVGGAAECYFYAGDYAKAEARALDLVHAGDSGRAYWIRGMILQKTGQNAEAMREWERGAIEGDRLCAMNLDHFGGK